MKIIGYKTKKAIAPAIWCFIVAIVVAIMTFVARNGSLEAEIIIILLCSPVYLIIIATKPNNLISIDANEENLYLYNEKIVIPVEDIKDVSYRQARIRVVRYLSWGKVIIKTNEKKIVVNYVEDCEEVTKYLLKIIYKNQ